MSKRNPWWDIMSFVQNATLVALILITYALHGAVLR